MKLFIEFGEVDPRANDHIESIQVKENPIS